MEIGMKHRLAIASTTGRWETARATEVANQATRMNE
jgi:hypothetical protein